MDAGLVEKLDKIADDRGLKNRSGIVIIACKEFVKREENPGIIDDLILAALEKNPALLEENVRGILQKIAAQQLSK